MTNPAQCHCGSISWERNIKENRFTCCSCKRPLWQPIETAPRDGTQVMLCDHDGDIYTGNYEAPYWWIDQWMPPMMDRDPPYWMPFPEGPGND
jgi:hypothetical protein